MSFKKYLLGIIFAAFFFNYAIFASQNEIKLEQDNNDKKVSYHKVLSAQDYIDATESYYFDTQKRDAKLHDYSDSLNFHKFKTELAKRLGPKFQYIDSPHVYRISLGNKSLILLGSCHKVPLEYFSKEIRNIFDQCHFMAVECNAKGKINRTMLEKISALQHENSVNIFSHSDDAIKNHFKNIVKSSLKFCQIKDVKYKDLDPYMAYTLYLFKHNSGMDGQIANKFSHYKKSIFSLENVEQKLIKHLKKLSKQDPFILYQKIENDFTGEKKLDTSFIRDLDVSCRYITGDSVLLHWILKLDDKLILERNYSMKKKLDKILSQHPQGLLTVVGLAHLFKQCGLLSLYQQQGWSIERADSQGNFYNFYY